MTKFRYCKFADGTIKDFENIVKGDVFEIFEPNGEVVSCVKDKNLTWFKAREDYNEESLGFIGNWVK